MSERMITNRGLALPMQQLPLARSLQVLKVSPLSCQYNRQETRLDWRRLSVAQSAVAAVGSSDCLQDKIHHCTGSLGSNSAHFRSYYVVTIIVCGTS